MQKQENRRIDSWKGIAAFFGRDARTVKRWEKERALPVYRVPGSERGGVFAYRDELTAWLHAAPATAISLVDGDKGEAEAILPGAAELDESDAVLEGGEQAVAEGRMDDASVIPYSAAPRITRQFAAGVGLLIVSVGMLAADALGRSPWRGNATATPVARMHGKPDAGAEELYLKGRYLWNHRTGASLSQAADAFSQAIARDPTYAEAYAGLAETYDLMPEYSSVRRSEAFPRAIAAANQAVRLDASLPEAHRALAFGLFFWSWEVPRALAEYRRAIELAPGDVESHHWYATSLLLLGRNQEAMVEIEKARKLNPASPSILADRSLIVDAQGDHEGAINSLEAIERNEPGFLSPPRYLAKILMEQERYPEFVAQSERAAALSGDASEKALADAARRGWRSGGKEGLLEAIFVIQEKAFVEGKASGFALARTCVRLGRTQQAVHYLNAALAAHDYDLFTISRGSLEAGLRDDEGFRQLERQMQGHIEDTGAAMSRTRELAESVAF